jgi:hypothetical protein
MHRIASVNASGAIHSPGFATCNLGTAISIAYVLTGFGRDESREAGKRRKQPVAASLHPLADDPSKGSQIQANRSKSQFPLLVHGPARCRLLPNRAGRRLTARFGTAD